MLTKLFARLFYRKPRRPRTLFGRRGMYFWLWHPRRPGWMLRVPSFYLGADDLFEGAGLLTTVPGLAILERDIRSERLPCKVGAFLGVHAVGEQPHFLCAPPDWPES